MTDKPKGPTSYFAAIEQNHGRPVADYPGAA